MPNVLISAVLMCVLHPATVAPFSFIRHRLLLTIPTSVVVPPISSVKTVSIPVKNVAPTTLAAGPERIVLNTEVIIPEHSEVANAVGAAVGKVSERVTVIIKPGFKVHAPWGCETFMEIEDARKSALSKGKENAIENAQKAGILNPEITVNHDVSSCETSFGKVFLGEFFEIIASGYPQRVSEHSA